MGARGRAGTGAPAFEIRFDGALERISARLDFLNPSGCWIWTGALNDHGYGHVGWGGRVHRVHRLLYQVLMGEIGDELVLDHLCRDRRCANPSHLEPVSHYDNWIRGESPSAICTRAWTCVTGHPRTVANTYVRPDGTRLCRICRDRYQKTYNTKASYLREGN